MILQESTAKVIGYKCLSVSVRGSFDNLSDEENRQIIEKMENIVKARYCLQGMDNSTVQGVNIFNELIYKLI